MVGAELFAFGSVKFLEESGDEVFLDLEFTSKLGVLRDQFLALLVFGVDDLDKQLSGQL